MQSVYVMTIGKIGESVEKKNIINNTVIKTRNEFTGGHNLKNKGRMKDNNKRKTHKAETLMVKGRIPCYIY